MDIIETSSPVCGGILTDVVAFVEVWSSNRTENYSKTFSQQLLNLGAKISKTFNKQVTHVVFKDGGQGTWDKAVKTGVKLVSILWVEKCREAAVHIDESLFPAINTNDGLMQLIKKKRKCMQPKDFVEKTPENDKRLQRKLERMAKELDEQKANVDVPVLLFDNGGTLMYSPKAVAGDRCNAMEKRIKEMKNKRENLSPTASQMLQTFDFPPLKPSLGDSPLSRNSYHDDDDSLDTSYDELWGSLEKKQEIVASRSKKTNESTKCLSERAVEKEKNYFLNHCNKSDNGSPIPKYSLDENEKGPSTSCLKKHKPPQNCKIFDRSTEGNDSENELFHDQQKAKQTSELDYTSLANRLIAKCKWTNSNKKRSRATPPNSCSSIKVKEIKETIKPHPSIHTSDSEDANFEDFFSSSHLKNHKAPVTRFSLGALPRKSPSPPPLTSNKKRVPRKRRQSAEDNSEMAKCSRKRRKIDNTNCTHLILKPVVFSNSTEDTSKFLLQPENVSSENHTVSNITETSTEKSDKTPTTKSHLEKLDVTVKEEDKLVKANVCVVKGLEKVNKIETCKNPLDDPEPKEKPGLKNYIACGNEDQMKSFSQSAQSKTSECDAVHGLSEMLNEQRNKCTKDSKKKERTRKIARSLVMTSMCSEKQSAVIQVVKSIGGFLFTDHVSETTTHVIAGSPRRTLNIILGIARGCWIVSYDWVLWSLEYGYWIPEEPYELAEHFPGAPICRLQRHLSAGEYVQDLLSSVPTLFISPNSQPPHDKLSEVVQLCGGKVCRTLRQAKICIGKFAGKKPPDMQTISEKWLLDTITQHKLYPLENYLVKQ